MPAIKAIPLTIFKLDTAIKIPRRQLSLLARALFKNEMVGRNQSITLVCCTNTSIQKLNARYRKINRPTDVLSFAMGDDDMLGEIYISLEKAQEQAIEYGITFADEMKRLFVHGFFHLLGYDHKTIAERNTMEKKERKYWSIA